MSGEPPSPTPVRRARPWRALLPSSTRRIRSAGGPDRRAFQSVAPGDTPSRGGFSCAARRPRRRKSRARGRSHDPRPRAYRGTVTDADVQTLVAAYTSGRSARRASRPAFNGRSKRCSSARLRVPGRPGSGQRAPGVPYRLSDLELASRLSFFLWSSIPDDALLAVAEARDAP